VIGFQVTFKRVKKDSGVSLLSSSDFIVSIGKRFLRDTQLHIHGVVSNNIWLIC
jgi:hypothetical protein